MVLSYSITPFCKFGPFLQHMDEARLFKGGRTLRTWGGVLGSFCLELEGRTSKELQVKFRAVVTVQSSLT